MGRFRRKRLRLIPAYMTPTGVGEGVNWGHVDDPAFQATEARWARERAAAWERFSRAAGYLARLAGRARTAELDRFEALQGGIARRELEGYVIYRENLNRGD
jgi:hypothetical protein